ncbi:hypothetical protein [Streptomyces sp. NPDC059134]|uniref:hypothetical protein n=1 Tax=Streptomyces sp. NPDC059134 TaxID=3346738 RepID=UPI003691FEFE
MKPRKVITTAVLLAMALMVTACGGQGNGQESGGKTLKQVTMNEQQAIDRAEEIIRQAVDGMSPQPTLKRIGAAPVGTCIARDDHGPDDRVQVTIAYVLTGVPGSEGKKLVQQARDAWLKAGHTYNSKGEVDWAGPFPSVYMRTKSDDFWMDAMNGIVDRAKGEGEASLGVTSPCFLPPGGSTAPTTADPAALETLRTDDPAGRRALGYSSRIFDALRVRPAPAPSGGGLSTVRDESGTSVHHTWSTEPLSEAETVRALARAQAYLQSAGWSVRHVPTASGTPAVVALRTEDGTTAQLARSATGALRVAVTTPDHGPASVARDV